MPCIMVQAKKGARKIELKEFAHALSLEMKIDLNRINIIVNYFDEEDAFMGSKQEHLIINLWVSETNGKEFVDDLVKAVGILGDIHLSDGKKSIAVMCHSIEKGNLYIINH